MAAQRPTLCVVAGPNGSGKTTTTERVMASTMSVDEYFDELISQVHED